MNHKKQYSSKSFAIKRKVHMEIYLKPNNILIIGGGSGIGYATAQKCLDTGVKNIILASRNKDKLIEAKKTLNHAQSQKIHLLEFDIQKVNTHCDAILQAQKMLGDIDKIDGLVISSGVNFDGSNWKGFNISEEDWDRVMNINLKGVFFLIRNFSNILIADKRRGNICVVSSVSARRDLLSVYQISKNSISRIVHAYGKHLGEKGIILNAVEPGPTSTDMLSSFSNYTDGVRPGKKWTGASIQRMLRAEEIAEIIFFLLSNVGEVMAGSCILAGGGNKEIFP